MKILFLLPPSEGKKTDHSHNSESLKYSFKKPISIAENVSQKDLKCIGKRYEEGVYLNKNIKTSGTTQVIDRYSGVMYNAIDYTGMTEGGKKYFEESFGILSGMYGLLQPLDRITNYKLPIETKGLVLFWKQQITEKLNTLDIDVIVDLLPGSYKKMIDKKTLIKPLIEVDFIKPDGKKVAHGVKKIKGEWIKNLCEQGKNDLYKLGGEYVPEENKIIVSVL